MRGHDFHANPGMYDSMERVCERCGYVESAAPTSCPGDGADDSAAADRLYSLLAFFDTRDGSPMAELVRSAREGWERSGPDMREVGAWAEFDVLWARRDRDWRPA
jgi:hypothetical protein